MRYRFLRYPMGKSKAVTFSFDDGCEQDIRLADLMSAYKLKCTFNFNGKQFGQKNGNVISDEDARNHILKNGHEIAIHGYNHKSVGVVRAIEGIRDVLDCRTELEERFGTIIRGMAYPAFGVSRLTGEVTYGQVKKYLCDLDIAYARTISCVKNNYQLPADWHNWSPTAHYSQTDILSEIDLYLNLHKEGYVNPASRFPRLFYIWGHSYELDRNKNWDLMEEICRKFSSSEDIWCATNIEIYEYVNAYNSLVYSADGTMIYNPTLFELWLDIDGKGYSIKSGQTLKICEE